VVCSGLYEACGGKVPAPSDQRGPSSRKQNRRRRGRGTLHHSSPRTGRKCREEKLVLRFCVSKSKSQGGSEGRARRVAIRGGNQTAALERRGNEMRGQSESEKTGGEDLTAKNSLEKRKQRSEKAAQIHTALGGSCKSKGLLYRALERKKRRKEEDHGEFAEIGKRRWLASVASH